MNKQNRFETVFYDVDTQEDFMSPNGALALLSNEGKPIGAMDIADNLLHLTKYARERGIPILGSVDWHNKDSKEFSEKPDFANTFPEHCIANTFGAENIDVTKKLNPFVVDWDKQYDPRVLLQSIKDHQGDATVFRKDNFNVFQKTAGETYGIGNPYAAEIISGLGVKNAVLYGVATDVCDNFAVQGLQRLGVNIYAVQDAMRGVTPKGHRDTLEQWRTQGVKLVKSQDVLEGRLGL